MKNRYFTALKTSTLSIAPMIAIVFLLSVIPPMGNVVNFDLFTYMILLVGMGVLIVGLSLFQIGANQSLVKVGEYMGSSLSKQKKLYIVIIFSLALGALITCAEPSILIVTKQVNINPVLLIGFIAGGVGIFVAVGVLRIFFQRSLKLWYLLFYAITFMLLIFIAMDPNKKSFLPFIFDSGGVTTGSATVPFILSLGAGVAIVRAGRNAKNDSFGLVGMASIGPILTMTILILISGSKSNLDVNYATFDEYGNNLAYILVPFFKSILPYGSSTGTLIDVAIALAPILIIFLIYNAIFIKLPWQKILSLLIGFFYAYGGLVLFLSATNAVMTPIGYSVGSSFGSLNKGVVIAVAFIIGLVTILCEPAVHVLTGQMESISDGQIKKRTVLLTLSIGVGIAIGLAVIRTLFNFSILYYMIPGYILSLVLMFVCPDIYTAMAFDSGGTASGPMSSSFVLPMIVGITTAFYEEGADYYEQSFGVIALIALTPVIAIQVLGVAQKVKQLARVRLMRRGSLDVEDAQIIHF